MIHIEIIGFRLVDFEPLNCTEIQLYRSSAGKDKNMPRTKVAKPSNEMGSQNSSPLKQSSNENYCYKILNAYGFLVSFQGRASHQNPPNPEPDETFAKWKRRVLGPDAHDVVVYLPDTPDVRTRVATLQEKADLSALKSIFKKMRKDLTAKREREVSEARMRTAKDYSTLPRETLEDIRNNHDLKLTPAIQEFLDDFIKSKSIDIGFEALLKDLILRYNEASKQIKSHS